MTARFLHEKHFINGRRNLIKMKFFWGVGGIRNNGEEGKDSDEGLGNVR